MELHYQGVLEKEHPLPRQRPGVAPPVAKGHGCFEECEAVGYLSIPEKGLGLGKFLDMAY